MNINKSFLLILFIPLFSCEKEEKDPALEDFCNVKPTGWECQIIRENFNAGDIPRNAKEPFAIIKFLNPDKTINRLGDVKVSPSLILDLYPINKKQELLGLIKSQRMYSWCVPIYYGETKDYFILTSPCFINGGTFTAQADSGIIDLHNALKKIINIRNYDFNQN